MKNRLFVRNLSWAVTEDDLYDLFGRAGQVTSVKIPTRREDGKSRGFAFVEMSTEDEAQQVIQQFNAMPFKQRELSVDYQDESRASAPSGGARSFGNDTPASPNPKLFVRNVSNSVSDTELNELFGHAGTVISVSVPTDRETGQPRGFAFVEMASTDDATQAVEKLNGHSIGGKELAVQFQDPTRAKPSGGGYGAPRERSTSGYGY